MVRGKDLLETAVTSVSGFLPETAVMLASGFLLCLWHAVIWVQLRLGNYFACRCQFYH